MWCARTLTCRISRANRDAPRVLYHTLCRVPARSLSIESNGCNVSIASVQKLTSEHEHHVDTVFARITTLSITESSALSVYETGAQFLLLLFSNLTKASVTWNPLIDVGNALFVRRLVSIPMMTTTMMTVSATMMTTTMMTQRCRRRRCCVEGSYG